MSREFTHDAAYVPVGAQIGQMRLEVTPLARRVAHPEDQLLDVARLLRRLEAREVVLVDHPDDALAGELRLRLPGQPLDRGARVAAVASREDEDEVGRRRDEAAEVRGLTPRRRDERPGEQERDDDADGAECDLQRDRVVDVAVRVGDDLARGAQ